MIKKTLLPFTIAFVLLFTLIATPTPVYADSVEVIGVAVIIGWDPGDVCAQVNLSDGSSIEIIADNTFTFTNPPGSKLMWTCRGQADNPPEQNIQTTILDREAPPDYFLFFEISPSGQATVTWILH